MKQLYTKWGRNLDSEHVLEEYPRPLLKRENYTSLNGLWEYAFTKEYKKPECFEGKILVPFSPESALSGVGRQLQPDEYLWYRRKFSLFGWNEKREKCRLLLHFGAVDQSCVVSVNGQRAAAHTGGYLPFETDISEWVRDGENELVVTVKDLSDTSYHARGKQKLKRGGMFYTAQSGIWQTVWMEEVPFAYVEGVETVPDLNGKKVCITVKADAALPVEITVYEPRIYDGQEEWGTSETAERENTVAGVDISAACPGVLTCAAGYTNEEAEVFLPQISPWTCETPYLYYFTVKMGEDMVESYFAMREFSVKPDGNGFPRICLNGDIQFQNGVLDQGYWPDGLYTAPSDEAMIFDIRSMKEMGFNMVRKHSKIEPQRWYYHCDRLGIVVWQDMVNGGSAYKHWFVTYAATVLSWRNVHVRDHDPRLFSRESKAGRNEFVREMKETIQLLKNHPSIAVWVIFNEGWGQFQAEKMTEIVRGLDPTRLIDQASGWFDQNGGDFSSVHNYFFKLRIKTETRRAAVLSEFGGYSMKDIEHSACEEEYGYRKYKSKAELNEAYGELMEKVKALIPQGLCACVYTQWTDVEEETNGVYTYDREVRKLETVSFTDSNILQPAYLLPPPSFLHPGSPAVRPLRPPSHSQRYNPHSP